MFTMGNNVTGTISLTECNSGTTEISPFGVNTAIELKEMTATSDNDGIQRGVLQLTSAPVFSDVLVKFLSSILVLTPNGQFLCCAATQFSERHIVMTE